MKEQGGKKKKKKEKTRKSFQRIFEQYFIFLVK